MITERPHTRARNVALIGLAFQVLLFAFFVILAVWTSSEALRGLMLLSMCAIPVWLYLVLVFQQRVLVQREEEETDELRHEREASGTTAIFDQENLLLAQRRLRWMYRWLLWTFTIGIVGLLVLAALVPWPWSLRDSLHLAGWPPLQAAVAALAIWFIGGAAFISFLLSRFTSGLSHYPEWRMLRCGASWLMGIALGAVAVAGTLVPLHYYPEMVIPERVVAYVLRVLLLVLAVETLFNFVLDFYRPRSPGEEPRPAFDSRLLGLFSEPGGIARSIADAVNYQFGFEVSSTWLYKLLERAALPLAGFAVLVLFAASSFVIVQADEEAVILRRGRPLDEILQPGLHVKYPWPIDVAYKVSTQKIHECRLGEAGEPDRDNSSQLILWTNKHYEEPHLKVLIATPRLEQFMSKKTASQPSAEALIGPTSREASTFAETGSAVSVSMLRVAMTIQYEIKNAKDWISGYQDPEEMLKAIASHELTKHCASQTVEGMLGEARGKLEATLRKQIADIAEPALGIRILFLGLQGVHPPEETAEAFQEVIGAQQKSMAAERNAWADYNTKLSKVAGDKDRAEALAQAIARVNQLESDPKASAPDRLNAREQVHTLFFGRSKEQINPIGGEAAGIIAKARAMRWALENQAHAQAVSFTTARAIKDAAPGAFYLREKLNAFATGLEKVRKYVLAARGDLKVSTIHLNLQDPANAQLDFGGKENQ